MPTLGIKLAPQNCTIADLRAVWRIADEAGFDHLWAFDHFAPIFSDVEGDVFEGMTLLAAMAEATSRVRIGLMVTGTTYRHPGVLAKMATTIDHLSGGRLEFGIGASGAEVEHTMLGIPFGPPAERVRRLGEALTVCRKLWTEERTSFDGRFYELTDAVANPKPLQKPYPPVWLAGGGSVETWELAATRDFTYSYLSFFGYQFARKLMGGFWDTMDQMGTDRNPYRAGFAQIVCVSETDERAEQEYLEHVTYFLKKCLHVAPWFREAPGDPTRRSTEFAIKTNQPDEVAKMLTLEKDWKALVDHGFIIAGSPATVADRLIEAAKTLRFGNLHALLQIGSMPHDLTVKNTTLFAEEVIPRIRNLWADEGWKHEWWPIGAADRTEAVA